MKKTIVLLSVAALFIMAFSVEKNKKKYKVLVFSKTSGFHHSSIPDGIKAVQKLGEENGFLVESTTDSLQFNDKNLAQYAAVIFMNTTGDVLGENEQKAFEKYIHAGKGYVGVHAASDTEYGWPWYNGLVGAYFVSHPAQQQAILQVKDRSFIATKHLPAEWSKWDEWYNFKDTHWDKVHVLMTLDEKSIKGGANGDFHPVSWYQTYEGGRAFYTALGHTEASYTDSLFLQHLLGGIKYAAGKR
jgi:uncharacterized protein